MEDEPSKKKMYKHMQTVSFYHICPVFESDILPKLSAENGYSLQMSNVSLYYPSI